eukprot:c17936_g1_i4.p1 GENE.c17936_g1_i4~~c17936_g1_i4.p1  ORF type:complete len:113 (+),score=17.28 c17936_g1_i4:298-636(+)
MVATDCRSVRGLVVAGESLSPFRFLGHVEVVRLLLKSGAKTNLVDTCGMTARDRASSQKHHTVIELFDREIRRQRFQMFLLGTLRRTKTQDKPSFVSTLPVDVLEMIAASVL